MKTPAIPALLLTLVVATSACSEDQTEVPGKPCVFNSDCKNLLVCTFMKCHEACRVAGDCPVAGQRCARASQLPTSGVAPGSPEAELQICLLQEEESCEGYNSKCPGSLVCGRDLKCRAECLGNVDCPKKQMCVPGGQHGERVCAEPEAIQDGMLRAVDGGVLLPDAAPSDGGAPGDGAPGDGPAAGGDGAPADAPAPGDDAAPAANDGPGADSPVSDGPSGPVTTHPPSEMIKTPTMWTGEHVIKGLVRVAAPLTIACPATIRVEVGTTFTVLPGGSVVAMGGANCPVVFTSNRTSPAPGDWAGLALAAGSNETKLSYVQIEYAQSGVTVASMATAAFDHVTVRKSKGVGMLIPHGASVSQFDSVLIEDAGTYALDVGTDVVGQLKPFTSTPPKPVRVTTPNGSIKESAIWQNLGVPYELGGPVAMFLQGAVTLNAGVELRLGPAMRLTVSVGGSLKTLGTAEQKVLITSANATRGPGDWYWIYFAPTAASDCSLEHTIIEYAGGSMDFAVQVDTGAQVAFSNVTIRKSAADGLLCSPGARLAKFEGMAFEDNAGYPLAVASNLLTKLQPITSVGSGKNFVRVVNIDMVTDPGTWRKLAIPYEVSNPYSLKVQARIDVEAGTELRFQTGVYLELKLGGSLHALGTEAANVVLRSWKEPPAAGDWPGVYVYQSAGTDSLLRWTQIRHGGGNTPHKAGLTLETGAMMTLENATFAENATCDVSGAVSATASTFTPCP